LSVLVRSLIIFALSSAHIFAATKSISISELEKNAKNAKKEVESLAQDLTALEKKLGQKNHEFLNVLKLRQELEAKLVTASRMLEKEQSQVQEESQRLNQVLKHLALQQLDQHQNAASMAAGRVLLTQVKKQMGELAQLSIQSKQRQEDLKNISQKLQEFARNERQLSEVMTAMEEQKKSKADAYLEAMGRKGQYEERLSELKLKLRLKKSQNNKVAGIDVRFSSPMDEYLGVEYDKKGITYKFTGRRPVIAAEAGEVVYAGRLSTYGNVVMIDHGNETRTVILGQFIPKLNKGQKVARLDVLGYTENVSTQGKLYFEVRKRDKVVETISLMDDKFLAKNSVTKI